MKKPTDIIRNFVLVTGEELTPLETVLSPVWQEGLELGFDDVRCYDEPPEEILCSKEVLDGLIIEDEGNLYHAPHCAPTPKESSVPPTPFANGIMTEKEVAKHLGVSWWTVRRWRVKGNLPFIRLNAPSRRVFYRMETVMEWLKQQEGNSITKHQESRATFISVI